MTVGFDAETLLAFSFDEPGASEVERWLDAVYDGERDGYVTTINLAEFRYVAARKTTVERADAHIEVLSRRCVRPRRRQRPRYRQWPIRHAPRRC